MVVTDLSSFSLGPRPGGSGDLFSQIAFDLHCLDP
jgi:hypothetical protein